AQAQLGQTNNIITVQVPFFFILAMLAGYLGQQRFREREERFILQQLVDTELKARGLVENVKQLDEKLTMHGVAADIVNSVPRILGIPYCALLMPDTPKQNLVLLASNMPKESGLLASDIKEHLDSLTP